MSDIDTSATLINAIADLEEENALVLVRQRLEAGDDSLQIIEDCQEGMRQVGLRYERQEYYLAGLIMAGEIFSQTMELLQPVIESQVSGQASGRILLGTVQNDIHDLGKNIVNMLLRCNSFVVKDLGVDVSPDIFVKQVALMEPHIVGISGLLTGSYESMRETIHMLRTNGYQEPIIIGGGQLSEEVREYVGADHWSTDAVTGVELCRQLMSDRAAKA